MIFISDLQPITEIVAERQAEFLAGLHQTEHVVTRLTTVSTDRATRDLSLDDKAVQIIFRGIGVQWDFGPLKNPQQFCLASFQTRQELVEIAIAGVDEKIRSNLASRAWLHDGWDFGKSLSEACKRAR